MPIPPVGHLHDNVHAHNLATYWFQQKSDFEMKEKKKKKTYSSSGTSSATTNGSGSSPLIARAWMHLASTASTIRAMASRATARRLTVMSRAVTRASDSACRLSSSRYSCARHHVCPSTRPKDSKKTLQSDQSTRVSDAREVPLQEGRTMLSSYRRRFL